MSGAPGVAAKEYFIKIITALSLLHVQMLFGFRFTEYRQTPTKAILATKGCLSECHAILANDAKPKASLNQKVTKKTAKHTCTVNKILVSKETVVMRRWEIETEVKGLTLETSASQIFSRWLFDLYQLV